MSETVDRSSLSREEFNNLLTFDGSGPLPTPHDPIIRDDNNLLIYSTRCRNSQRGWEIRYHRVVGDGISFKVDDQDRAAVAAVLIETFEPGELTSGSSLYQSLSSREIPVAVAVDGKPAIAAWLYVRGDDRDEIAQLMKVGEPTVGEYLSRFRRRGVGVPDSCDVPPVGGIMPEVPARFNPGNQQIVAGGGDL